MIMWCYVEKDSDGNYHIINDADLSEEVLQFVDRSNHSEEVRKLASSVNVKLKEALSSDEDLNSVYGVLRDGSPVYDNGEEPAVVIGDEESSESSETGTGNTESADGSAENGSTAAEAGTETGAETQAASGETQSAETTAAAN